MHRRWPQRVSDREYRTGDDIRRFQLAQVEQGAQPPKMNT
jgi:hypothetical protein